MKQLLLPLLFLPLPSFAQHTELGLNGGVATYTGFNTGIITTTPSVAAPVTSLKAMHNTGHYQYGISADYRKIAYTLRYALWGDLYCIPQGSSNFTPQPFYIYRSVVNSQYPLRAFANRMVSFRRLQLYGGAFAGYIYSQWLQYAPGDPTMLLHRGWMYAGAQAGATYYVTKHIGLNAEAEADYNFTNKTYSLDEFENYYGNKNRYVYPATVGVRYRL